MSKKKGLGRGLDHLIKQNMEELNDHEVVELDIKNIKPNPYQPRKFFNEEALKELSDSIKENGVFQPILVRQSIIGYEIISGERRYRASKLAGLSTIPAIIYDFDDQQMMEVAIVENVQREDLSVVEEAKSYKSLIDNLNYTQDEVAKKVGKSRSHIANILRLLKLDEETLDLVEEGKLTMGHVKVLINIEDKSKQKQIIADIIKNNLNVRQAEELASVAKGKPSVRVKPKVSKEINNARNKRLEKMIREKVNAQVSINGDKKGSIEFKFNSEEELENILEQLNLV